MDLIEAAAAFTEDDEAKLNAAFEVLARAGKETATERNGSGCSTRRIRNWA